MRPANNNHYLSASMARHAAVGLIPRINPRRFTGARHQRLNFTYPELHVETQRDYGAPHRLRKGSQSFSITHSSGGFLLECSTKKMDIKPFRLSFEKLESVAQIANFTYAYKVHILSVTLY
jgi:hypothetical protein